MFATLSVPQMHMNLSPAPYNAAQLGHLSGGGSGKMPMPKAGSGLIRAQD